MTRFTLDLIATLTVVFIAFATIEARADQSGLMPSVNSQLNMATAIGFNTLRVKPATELPVATGGAFRIVCAPSHMSYDDPIVFPMQPNKAHHHTFFGNTSTNYASDLNNMDLLGNSTCKGGLANRSAYWIPSMINTATNAAVLPEKAIIYYKTGYVPAGLVKVPPKGLRMIAGNMRGNSEATSRHSFYTCAGRTPFYGWKKSIPVCNVGEYMGAKVEFPQCWDGKNLDAPDHQSHMAYSNKSLTTANKCPATHPVGIPLISFNFSYLVAPGVDMSKWRLASDNYIGPAGYSGHSDWLSGWNANIIERLVKNCLNKGLDCHASLLGDGYQIY